jgi:RNA polymerase sigma-70 factor (ECF subfamily)
MGEALTAGWHRRRAAAQNVATPLGAERRHAFAAMARRCEGDLLRTARRLCGPAHGGEDRARDLVQDALVRAYEAFLDGQYVEGDDLTQAERRRERAWLLRTLTNGFINDYRRRRKWEAGVTVDEVTAGGTTAPQADLRAAPSDTPGEALLASALDEPLERALLSLPEGMRLCIVLVEIEGLEYAEAAAAMGIPIGTVRSRLSRARLQLQAILEDYARERRLR